MPKLLLLLLSAALAAVAAGTCGDANYHCVSSSAFCLGGQAMECAAGTHCITQPNDKTSPCVSGPAPDHSPSPSPAPSPGHGPAPAPGPEPDHVQSCTGSETIPSYEIEGKSFKDVVEGTFVGQAYEMAQSYVMELLAEEGSLGQDCHTVGVPTPIHACYTSVRPGSRKGAQQLGQYGFQFDVQYTCADHESKTLGCEVITLNNREHDWVHDPMWQCTPLLL